MTQILTPPQVVQQRLVSDRLQHGLILARSPQLARQERDQMRGQHERYKPENYRDMPSTKQSIDLTGQPNEHHHKTSKIIKRNIVSNRQTMVIPFEMASVAFTTVVGARNVHTLARS
jgi:hypothetical protein